MPSSDLLQKYADVAIRVGMALKAGDRLLISAPVLAADFARVLVDTAYKAGALSVDVLWSDDAVTRSRYENGSAESSNVVSSYSHAQMAAYEAGDAFLYVFADDPNALAGVDLGKVAGFQKINGKALEPLNMARGTMRRPWSVVAAPTEPWATTVFPDASAAEAVELLWSAIFRACRADQDDPVAAWRLHAADLFARSNYLSAKQYTGLRYEAPGTDLRLGLPAGALWMGGNDAGAFVPNIPTEEVFAAPHRLVGEGVVSATKPLSLFGTLVEGFSFEVSGGKIVKATADRGQESLDQLLATDDGSVRFGEAAMVPMSGAVAAEELIWNNMLYDENDGCHIAVGRAYQINVEGGTSMSPDELTEAGLNQSTTHVDFVVGSDELDVFGVLDNGTEEPIITNGEWGFTT